MVLRLFGGGVGIIRGAVMAGSLGVTGQGGPDGATVS